MRLEEMKTAVELAERRRALVGMIETLQADHAPHHMMVQVSGIAWDRELLSSLAPHAMLLLADDLAATDEKLALLGISTQPVEGLPQRH